MRIVLDTNVLISAFASDGLCRQIVRKRALAHELITSAVLIDELRDKLRTKFQVELDDYTFLAPRYFAWRRHSEGKLSLPATK